MTIVGQEKLLSRLNNYTVDTLPKTLLFIGPDGCGKHTISLEIANKLGLPITDIDENISVDKLIEFSHRPYKMIYRIDLDKFTEKAQNQFLKFIEEPADSVYIILMTKSEIGVLPTILNRCVKYIFDDYTPEQLRQFPWLTGNITDDLIFKVCKTPGQLSSIDSNNFENSKIICQDIVNNIKTYTYAGLLGIIKYLNFKEDYTKINFELFFNLLEYIAFSSYINGNDIAFIIYNITNKYKQDFRFSTISKESFTIKFFNELWEATR